MLVKEICIIGWGSYNEGDLINGIVVVVVYCWDIGFVIRRCVWVFWNDGLRFVRDVFIFDVESIFGICLNI